MKRNMKRIGIVWLLLLSLCACGTQEETGEHTAAAASTPSAVPAAEFVYPTPDGQPKVAHALQIDIGDGEHSFWVEVVDTGEPYYDSVAVKVSIYRNQEDIEPIQTFEDQYGYPYGLGCFSVEDVDFDGDMDFSFCTLEYRSFHEFSYYIWDETREEFVQDPYDLNHLNHAQFDPVQKAIRSSYVVTNGASGEIEYYRYLDSGLTCIRRLTWDYWGDSKKLMVEDGADGALAVVYEEALTWEELPSGQFWPEEFSLWDNLDYHGEE